MDTMAVQLPAGIAELHMDPPEPVPDLADSMLVGELPPAAVDTLLEAVGPGSASQLVSVELRHCGAARSRGPHRTPVRSPAFRVLSWRSGSGSCQCRKR